MCCLVVIGGLANGGVASVPPMINYQGKLMQPSGVPVPDGTYQMTFAIYDVPTGGTPLWSETNGSVQVKGGLFSVLLGSVNNLPGNIFDSPDRWFGVTVGSDPEMTPRQRIASAAFAFGASVADTVRDGAITAEKVAAGAITGEKLASAAVTTDKLADGAVSAAKLAPGVAIPPGTILMWSGSVSNIPQGWALCDGTNGTPDLRDRFIVGAGGGYAVGATGGAATVTLTVEQMPSHSHGVNDPGHGHYCVGSGSYVLGSTLYAGGSGTSWMLTSVSLTGITIQNTGGGQAHENRPPYYALCYIMKLPY